MKELESTQQFEQLRQEVEMLDKREIKEISYANTMDIAMQELKGLDINQIPSWWFEEFDNTFWLLMRWQVYVVWGITGTGKSTFITQVCQNVSQQWFRVSLYTLEDRIETIRQNDLYFSVNRIRKEYGQEALPKWKFMAWVYKDIPELQKAETELKKKNINLNTLKHNWKVTIKIIEEMIKEAHKAWSKVIALDHLHYFDTSDNVSTDRHDLVIKDIMHRINSLARELNICIIIVAHYKKLWKWEKPTLSDFSWSISIAQVANWIIHIYRDKWNLDSNKTEFIIDKNRDMWITKTIEWTFNLSTYEYEFNKSELAVARKRLSL